MIRQPTTRPPLPPLESESTLLVPPTLPQLNGHAREFPALNHYDYDIIDAQCCCGICKEWRAALDALQAAQRIVAGHHRGCPCENCRAMMRLRSSYLAALGRRDLYSELSWHVERRRDGTRFMSWLHDEVIMDRDKRTDGWWEARAPNLPIAYWFVMFNRALVASGLAAAPLMEIV